ncbi:ATP-binding protein [Desulfoplanes sp.]
MDLASRKLCGTDDNREALSCGKWLCHENCWNDSAKKAIESGKSTDIECVGGIRLYAEPIYAGQNVIGAINIGYGEPPRDPDKLEALARSFRIDPEQLNAFARSYRPRPRFIVDTAKNLLSVFARLIGEIVEKKEAHTSLQRVSQQTQALLDHSPACHKIVGLDSNLRYMSASGFKMLQIDDAAQVYGKPYPFAFFPLAFRNEMSDKLKEVKHTGTPLTMEALATDTRGNGVWLYSHLLPVFDTNGRMEYITVVTSDTTRRKEDEQAKRKLSDRLQHAQKLEAVGTLAGGVAHDFNNMLAVIMGNTELAMQKTASTDPAHTNLNEILTATRRSTDIVRQLLAFARKQTIAPEVLTINGTIEQMLKMLRRLIGENINLAWRPGSGLWPIKIDPTQLDQVLANLTINARDSIEDVGNLTIETCNVTFDGSACADNPDIRPGDFVMLAVSDNGCGIDTETRKKIFEPFFTTKEVDQGTGLGLATVYGIVKQNDGFINVYSEPDQGTTFRIYWPRHGTCAEPSRTGSVDSLGTRGDETILVVEDEVGILRMVRTVLENFGYTVLTASTPNEAINIAQNFRKKISLLLTDVVMPGMNGRDLADELLSSDPGLRCLFMSGYTKDITGDNGILAKGTDFIQKPCSASELLTRVRKVLDG